MFQFLKSVLSPQSAMRIDPATETPAQLQQKLHTITQYLINSGKQFDTWMELQNGNNLHYCLEEVYRKAESGGIGNGNGLGQGGTVGMAASEEELVSIIQFYTMLLINSKDQLLICKLVSDSFVLKLCKLDKIPQSLASDLQAYRINLIKAYMSKITPQTIKYMIIHDKYQIFQTCILLFSSKIGTGTVQFTTISNTILNIMNKCDGVPLLWDHVWRTQGLQLLFTGVFQFVLGEIRGDGGKFGKGLDKEINNGKKIGLGHMKKLEEKKEQLMEQVKGQKQPQKQQKSQQEQKQKAPQKIEQKTVEMLAQTSVISKQQHFDQQQIQQEPQNDTKPQTPNQNSAININQLPQPQQQQQSYPKKQPSQLIQPQPQKQQQKNPKPLTLTLTYQKIQLLHQLILFLVQLHNSVTTLVFSQKIQQYCYLYLEEMLEILLKNQIFEMKVYMYSVMYVLFVGYNFQREAVEAVMDGQLDEMLEYLEKRADLGTKNDKKYHKNHKILDIPENQALTRTMFILAKIITSKYSYLSQRNLNIPELGQQKYQKITATRCQILLILIKLINNSMEIFENQSPGLFLQFVRCLLVGVFYLKLAMGDSKTQNKKSPKKQQQPQQQTQKQPQPQPQQEQDNKIFLRLSQSILQLFLSYTYTLKSLLQKSSLWNSIIKWSEQATTKVPSSLLSLPPYLQPPTQDPSLTIMLIYENIRHYRYMIVEETMLDPKYIKQEKSYHSTFSSLGLGLEPGTTVREKMGLVCHCMFWYNLQAIPVVVLEDKECLIIGLKLDEDQYRILINIKFKDIQGFVYGNTQSIDPTSPTPSPQPPKFLKINLRGSQQLILEFSNPKVVGNTFKEYLIKSRDMSRQRQMSFLNQWVRDYQADTEGSLEKVRVGLKKKRDYIVL